MPRVLVVTYYWPPSGGPGVQRVLKFVKYLPAFGWNPVVLTVKNGEYPSLDPSLARDIPAECPVARTFAFEPGTLYRSLVGLRANEPIPVATLAQRDVSWRKRWANWIRLNLFLPDAKIGWIPSAVRAGKHLIRTAAPDLIFSSSPPQTVQLVADKLARASGLPWVADYRDPWTRIFHYATSHRTGWSRWYDRRLEERIVPAADERITVNMPCAHLLGPEQPRAAFRIIPNGFDEDDFDAVGDLEPYAKFTLTYAGNLSTQQNPRNLWTALAALIARRPDFAAALELRFLGVVAPAVRAALADRGLTNHSTFCGYVAHEEAIRTMRRSALLLLVIPAAEGSAAIVTGKIFEYMASRSYILGIGPRAGVAAEILRSTASGEMFAFEDDLAGEIEGLFERWRRGELAGGERIALAPYTRRRQTKMLAEIFDRVLAQRKGER